MQQDIHHAIEKTPLFPRGFQALPQTQRQVSLQSSGATAAPTGPSMVGSPETMGKLAQGSPFRQRLLKTLQTPRMGWQFGQAGSVEQAHLPSGFQKPPLKEQITPTTPQRPGLEGGVPLGKPNIKPGSEVVSMAGFKLDPIGNVELPPAPTNTLATSTTLETGGVGSDQGLGSNLDMGEAQAKTVVPTQKTLLPTAPKKVPLGVIPKVPTMAASEGIGALAVTIPQLSLPSAPSAPPPALEEIIPPAPGPAPDVSGEEGE